MHTRGVRRPWLVPLAALLAASGCADRDTMAPAAPEAVPERGVMAGPGPYLADPAQSLGPTAAVSADLAVGQPAGLLWQHRRLGRRVRWTLSATGGYTGIAAELRNTPAPYSIAAVADFNRDGHPDLAWENTDTGARSIWRMLGAYWPTHSSPLPTQPIDWHIAAAADFDRDGFDDIVWQNRTTGERKIWLMNGAAWDGREAALRTVPAYWDIAGAGDFDRDGSPDLVWQHTVSGERVIWLMDGAAWRGRQAIVRTVGTYWDIAAVGDVDGDGGPDLVWQHRSNGERVIWLMDGTAWRGRQVVLPTVPREWEIVGLMGISITGPAPTATTGAATSPTGTGVTLNAQVNTGGLPAIGWFEHRKAGDLDFTSTRPRILDGTSSAVLLEERVEGLAANLPYTFRVVIANAAAMARGAEQSFTLVLAAPEVATGDARDLEYHDGMTLQGTADPNGAATGVWFEWGTSPTLASAATTPVQDVVAGDRPATVSARITSLTRWQTYYYRLVAQNSQGTTRGAIRSVPYAPPQQQPTGLRGVFVMPGYFVWVTWDPTPTATYYVIHFTSHDSIYYSGSYGSSSQSGPPSIFRGFPVDQPHRVWITVWACNALGCGSTSTINTTTEVLAAPAEFTATASSEGVRLAWKDNSVGEAFFAIRKRIGSGEWTHVVSTNPNETTYTDRQVQAGVTYEYRMTAAVHGEQFPGELFVRHSAAATATVTHTGP